MSISGMMRGRLLVTVPNHKELAKGTLLAILRQAKLTRDEFLSEF